VKIRSKYFSLLLPLVLITTPLYAATPKASSTCTKVGATSTYEGKKFTCVKSGKKLVWNKGVKIKIPKPVATPTPTTTANPFVSTADQAAADQAARNNKGITCPVNGKCKIGNTGPGGGIVFYVAPTPQSWGQYLEVAPATWNGSSTDPEARWCDVTNISLSNAVADPELKKLIGTEIGKGKGNTQLMSTYCKSGAGNLATAYRGGGKSDWFLPSKNELNQMYAIYVAGLTLGDFSAGLYWSSSELSMNWAHAMDFKNGYDDTSYKQNAYYVRPVRAFS